MKNWIISLDHLLVSVKKTLKSAKRERLGRWGGGNFQNIFPCIFLMLRSKCCLVDWLVDWLVDCLVDWLVDCLVDYLVDCLVDCLVDWLVNWLVDWLIGWLVDWLIGWLVDWLVDWLVGLRIYVARFVLKILLTLLLLWPQ